MSKHASSKPGATLSRKPAASDSRQPVSQQKAQAIANDIYVRSTDLEVLVRHKVYQKTVGQINRIQIGLNRLRPHIRANLKRKSHAQWEGLAQDRALGAFIFGLILGFLLCWYFFAQPPVAGPVPSKPSNSTGRLTKPGANQ